MDQNGSLEVAQPTQESFISIELSDSGSRSPQPASSPLAPLEAARKTDQQEPNEPEEKTLLETMMEEPGFEFDPEIRLQTTTRKGVVGAVLRCWYRLLYVSEIIGEKIVSITGYDAPRFEADEFDQISLVKDSRDGLYKDSQPIQEPIQADYVSENLNKS